jgi:5-deoxy-5-amino-3-dehydroquinate synthase
MVELPGPTITEADLGAAVDDREPGGRAPVVVAGDGAVATTELRRLLARRAVTVWLDDGDRSAQRRRWLGPYTTTADAIVADPSGAHADGISLVDALGEAAMAAPSPSPVRTEPVAFGDGRCYPVMIGRGVADRLAGLIPDGVRRVAVITQDGIGVDIDPGVEHRVFRVEDGERAKSLAVLGDLASQLARWGLTRNDAIVGVGGGVVTDLAGYLAASYHRGVPVIHVSTTLLGQIDAAIGGKCGVNLPEGKNLLGAFKQPAGVLCDTAALATLPPSEFLSGMGELAKYHFLGGGRLDRLPLVDRVAACARIKGDVVAGDENESGRRVILNYGHTLAHAVESVTDYGIRHGEAVAVGLIYAAELARRLGRVGADRVAEHRRVVAAYGLDTTIPPGLDPDELVDAFTRDKKAVAGITFVLDGPDGVEPVVVDDRCLLRATLETVT